MSNKNHRDCLFRSNGRHGRTFRFEPLEERRLLTAVGDYGDAPASYGDACHDTVGIQLGGLRDSEPASSAPLDGTGDDVTGDDDEDGVVLPSAAMVGESNTLLVTVSEAGFLDAWVDWDQDGVFGAGEEILTSLAVSAGAQVVTFAAPSDALAGSTFARFRVSSTGGLAATGDAADGEVEDYELEVAATSAFGIELVSKSSAGVVGNHHSDYAVVSANGRYVAFSSRASNLVPGDLGNIPDVFVRDLVTGITERVSVDTLGDNGNDGIQERPSISADGRYVAFSSYAGLVPDDTNGSLDVFVRDRLNGTTERVSVDSLGNETPELASSFEPTISADGRYVAFKSTADNLVPDDTNGAYDVFVHDRVTGATTRVSVDSVGNEANSDSGAASISADGRYVAFTSYASNLVAGDTNFEVDVFVRDLLTGTTRRVSVDSSGNQVLVGSSRPQISADGRFVVFDSVADNLVSGDTNGASDVFMHELLTGVTSRVSVNSSGEQGPFSSSESSISADGRYVAFTGYSSNFVSGDTNFRSDVFVKDVLTGAIARVSLTSAGQQHQNDGWTPFISGDGKSVVFLGSGVLTADDTNEFSHDIYRASVPFPLFGQDHGDAPASYGDASHNELGVRLGGDRDSEPGAAAPLDASGDDNTFSDDEDGVILPAVATAGQVTFVIVDVSGAAYLDAWADWNQDGVFSANERFANAIAVSAGQQLVTINVPLAATGGQTHFRFRVSSTGGLAPSGAADDGEVEDYTVLVNAVTPPTLDLNGAGAGVDYVTDPFSYATAGGSPIMDATASITEGSQMGIVSAKVTITNFQAGDSLTWDAGQVPLGVSVGYASGVLTITGDATPEEYEDLLRSIRLSVQATASTVDRTLTVQINDGLLSSSANTVAVLPPQVQQIVVHHGKKLQKSFTAYDIATGQTRNRLPWSKIKAIDLWFSEPVDIEDPDLSFVAQQISPGAPPRKAAAFSYDASESRATFVFQKALKNDSYDLALLASVVDLDGGPSSAVQTGDAAGFALNIKVLIGDIDDDASGAVTNKELKQIRKAINGKLKHRTIFTDINGDGKWNIKDYNLAAASQGTELP